jgi:uncharacterized repeat protein (TIGR01451 family)
MKRLLITGLVLISGLFMAGYSYASYGSVACQPIYGGGETCEYSNKFVLDKKVLNPSSVTKDSTGIYVDNLSINDSRYAPGQKVLFELSITNTGNTTLSEITLTDIFPSYVTYISGAGSYDKNTNTLTMKVVNLNPNETRKYILEGKINDASNLPNGQGITCVVNQASATYGNDESKDNSQFCIEVTSTKGGLPVMPAPIITKTPATGPEMLPLLGLIPAGLGGLFLRKRSSK